MPVANQPLLAFLCQKAGMSVEEIGNLGLDGLRQKVPRTKAQNCRQRILKCTWLGELNDIILGHGVSSLNGKWRLEHPHDTPPHLITPSPTFSHSSVEVPLTVRVLSGLVVPMPTLPVAS